MTKNPINEAHEAVETDENDESIEPTKREIVVPGETIVTGEDYLKAFYFIIPGLKVTFGSTLISFFIAIILGLILGIGRISKNKISSTLSRTYIEFVRGVPILILIFTIAFVIVVDAAKFFNINNGLLSLKKIQIQ